MRTKRILIVALVAFAAVPGPTGVARQAAAAQPAEMEAAPGGKAAATEALVEDVLLLEAMQYLRLSRDQLRRLGPVAESALGELERGRRDEAPLLAQIERSAGNRRELLLSGKKAPLQADADALRLRQLLQEQRERHLALTAQRAAQRVAEILDRRQIQRAFQLVHDAVPEEAAVPRSLLDPASGFVLSDRDREAWQRGAVQEALIRRYPRRAVDQSYDSGAFGSFNIITGQIEPPEFPDELLAAVRRDRTALETRWNSLVDAGLSEATANELAMALVPLVRRLVLSPRFKPLLDETLKRAERPDDQR